MFGREPSYRELLDPLVKGASKLRPHGSGPRSRHEWASAQNPTGPAIFSLRITRANTLLVRVVGGVLSQ